MSASPESRRGRPPNPALQEQRREEILDAAARVFARHGYVGTDVQVVADALGVGKGTVYRYFPSKETLFLSTVDRGMCLLREAVDASGNGLDDPIDAMRAAVRAYLQFFNDRPELVELLIQERAEFRDRKKPTYFEHREANSCRWRDRIAGLIAAGRIRPMPVERVLDVVGDLLYGAMFTNHFTGRHRPLDTQAEDILDIVFHGMLTPAERRRQARRSDDADTGGPSS